MIIQNKKICIINHHATTPKTGGNNRHFQLAKALVERGYHVTLIASSNNFVTHKYYYEENYVTDIEHGVNIFWIKSKPLCKNTALRFFNYVDFYLKLKKKYKLIEKPDVVIGSSVHPLVWLDAAYICKKTGARFIAEIRDIWPLSMKEDLGKWYFVAKMMFGSIEKYTYKRAERIVCTMPYADEHVEKLIGKTDKVVWIPHGIDIEKFDKNKERCQAMVPDDIKNFIKNGDSCIYTGLFSASEGLEYLIKAAKILSDEGDMTKFALVGAGPERGRLEKIIHNNSLDNVMIFDKVPSDMVPVILNYAKMLFCGLADKAVFEYGISKNKFYDYFAAAKPIIFASNVRESLIDIAKAGFTVKAESPEEIANAIKKINKLSTDEYKDIAINGRIFVEKNHDNSIICDKFEALF